MSMGKRIPGSQRQRRSVLIYRALRLISWIVISCSLMRTLVVIFDHADDVSFAALLMYVSTIIILVLLAPLGIFHSGGNERRVLKLLQLFQFAVFVFVFCAVFDIVSDATVSFYIGSSDGGVVSGYEALFIWSLFHVGAVFLLVLISQDQRQAERNAVVGGVLIIMGILMPKVLESYSLLQAHCYSYPCSSEESSWSILFEMAIAYAASLSMMFVLGVFSSSVKQVIRRCVDFGEAKGLESSPVASSRGDVRVSTGESVASSDEQNDGVELAPGSSSTAACVPQETADGVVPRVCSEETSARPTVSLTSSSVSRSDDEGLTRSMESVMGPVGVSVPVEFSSGLGSVAVSKQLMGAAVSGVVAGVCFSIASRLFNRR